jgi:hypothetical protein
MGDCSSPVTKNIFPRTQETKITTPFNVFPYTGQLFVFMFFWLDPKEPKSQETIPARLRHSGGDIQHDCFIRLD